MIPMPVVRPVPIRTKGLPWYKRARQAFRPRKWELVQDYYYQSPGLGYSILIPAPFTFDGASVPRPLWPFLDPTGLLFIGALVHDFGYRYRGLFIGTSTWEFQAFSRWELDRIMETIVREVNGMAVMARLARIGVVAGGWLAWWQNRGHDAMADYPEMEITT